MKIVKVLNNSLLMALDDNGEEVILGGKGIGYKQSIGNRLRKEEISQIYLLKDRVVTRSIIRIAAEIGEEYFNLTQSVIDYAVKTYHMELQEHIYLALTDHFAFARQRATQKIVVQNFYTADLKRFNPHEYDVGRYGVRLFQERFGIVLPDGEISNIAFHFINAQKNDPYQKQKREIEEIVIDILNLIKYQCRIQFQEECTAYVRLVAHLRRFAQRLLSEQYTDYDDTNDLLTQLIAQYPEEYVCIQNIGVYVKAKTGMEILKQEQLYLMIHLCHLIEVQRHG